MDFLFQLLPHLINGVSLGLLFALIALGFMLIVGVMETINLAHGSLFALGMYVALFIAAPRIGWFPELQASYMQLPIGLRYFLALVLAPIFVGLFGMGPTPLRASAAEGALMGATAAGLDPAEIGRLAVEGLEPPDDLHASSGLRTRIGAASVSRALQRAIEEAGRA